MNETKSNVGRKKREYERVKLNITLPVEYKDLFKSLGSANWVKAKLDEEIKRQRMNDLMERFFNEQP